MTGRKCSTTTESKAEEIASTEYSEAALPKLIPAQDTSLDVHNPDQTEFRLSELLRNDKTWMPANFFPVSSLSHNLAFNDDR
jgi:hypothetical protein